MAEREERERGKSPRPSDEQDAPAPERPTNLQEDAGQGKPSQAEGERDQAEG
ncbi:MAG TPA: hypothetical protein VHG28_02650 [Longimicrobiaceae bacterium]|nr:hypothetical protein [Longimicrobiaceae bacterium]